MSLSYSSAIFFPLSNSSFLTWILLHASTIFYLSVSLVINTKLPPTSHHCKQSEGESASHLVVSNSLWSRGLYSPWNSPGQNTGMGSLSLFQGIFPTQGLKPGLPIAGRFFTSWATREPKNTGVGSLSLLQQIFLTQESNWGLLHCRQILTNWAIREALTANNATFKYSYPCPFRDLGEGPSVGS